MYNLLAGYLLAISFQWTDGLRQDVNKTIDASKLSKLMAPIRIQARVVGGTATTSEKLGGYIIALHYLRQYKCGGTLIHERIVLTAAHCFLRRTIASNWLAEGGISRLDAEGVVRQVVKYIRPDDFRQSDKHKDVALVLLSSPMTGTHIAKLELCNRRLKTGTLVTVAGWGKTSIEAKEPENLLRKVTLPIFNRKKCIEAYQPVAKITESMLCAGVLGEKDACTMDSGGPLVYQKRVCGIVSFGIGCASNKFPGVYTSVMSVKSFITKGKCQLLGNRG